MTGGVLGQDVHEPQRKLPRSLDGHIDNLEMLVDPKQAATRYEDHRTKLGLSCRK
jgi:hypothetical protein